MLIFGSVQYTGCMEKVWSEISRNLAQSIDNAQFKVWIAPLGVNYQAGKLSLYARNEFVAKFIRSHFQELIARAAFAALGEEVRVSIKAGPSPAAVSAPVSVPVLCESSAAAAGGPAPQVTETFMAKPKETQDVLPLDWTTGGLFGQSQEHRLVKAWRHSFDDFVVGPCNELAHAAARSVCESHSGFGSVLYLCSGPGQGKTHLMHSMGGTLVRGSNFRAPRLEYLTAEEFTSQMRLSIKAGEMERFKNRFREADVLLMEDVHFLQEKEKTQDELLATVSALLNRGSKVVFSSSFTPRELCKMDSQLLSRLSSGMIAAIRQPDKETRRRIIVSKATAQRVTLPEDVADYLAEAMGPDIRQIESCIQNLALKARFFNRAINLDMARETVSNYLDSVAVVNLPEIIRMVCEGFGVAAESLGSKSRKQEYVQARNTIFYLARKHTALSLQEIGRHFGRTHSTVIKGITSLEREVSRQTHSGRQLMSAIALIEKNAGVSRQDS